jgi:hypothetical protein
MGKPSSLGPNPARYRWEMAIPPRLPAAHRYRWGFCSKGVAPHAELRLPEALDRCRGKSSAKATRLVFKKRRGYEQHAVSKRLFHFLHRRAGK